MFANYLKVALRNLLKHKAYSFINIAGLAVALACGILILLYVRDELTFDRFHERRDSIFRITLTEPVGKGQDIATFGSTPPAMGAAMKNEFPELVHVVRYAVSEGAVKRENKIFMESLYFADAPFFEMFSFHLISGNAAAVLNNPSAVVISQEMAQKYFGTEDPTGKPLSFQLRDTFVDLNVAGVVQSALPNSSIQFNFLLAYDRLKDIWGIPLPTDWKFSTQTNVSRTSTFVQLHEGSSAHDFTEKLNRFARKNFAELDRQASFGLQPLTDIHLNGDVRGSNGLVQLSYPLYSYILSVMAVIILVVACINFVNLAIGQSASRGKEVGLRKVLGAHRTQLMRQFLGEALILSACALLVGVALAELFLPTFNTITDKRLSLSFLTDWEALGGLLALMIIVGGGAGGYPALVLSHFQPAEVLKSKLAVGGPSLFARVLIVAQFALSLFLIVGTIIIVAQVNYMNAKNLGFDIDNVIVVQVNAHDGAPLLKRLRQRLSGEKSISAITGSSYTMGGSGNYKAIANVGGSEVQVWRYGIDDDYLQALGVKLVDGKSFSANFAVNPENGVIVNNSFVTAAGISSPVGQMITLNGSTRVIVGVVDDYCFSSVQYKTSPIVLHPPTPDQPIKYIFIRTTSGAIGRTLEILKNAWVEIAPDLPFQYSFLDEDLMNLYRLEERAGKIAGYSSLFSILIASFGLYGITTLAVTRRTKEIGIRKVLGASTGGIVGLISSDFIKLFLLANAISWPAAYFSFNRLLEGYATRIQLSIWIFLFAGGLVLLVAGLTIGLHVLRSARTNPVDALRYE